MLTTVKHLWKPTALSFSNHEGLQEETGSSSRKRRHESGESVESGYFEADQAGSSEEKKIIDDGRDYLTLKTVDH